ncbi:MAG: SH3 domain-containing protein [Chloroflexota bacterium]
MNEEDEHALESLRRQQVDLEEQIASLDDQRRLFEKLGYSRYYLDMQLRALRAELTLCKYHIRRIEKAAKSPAKAKKVTPQTIVEEEAAGRYLLPVVGAFVVSVLALGAAAILWYGRLDQAQPTPVPPAPTAIVSMASPTPTVAVPTPTVLSEVYAVVKTEGLNVRQEPTTDVEVLRVLAKGDVIVLTEDQQDSEGRLWYQVKEGGWIAVENVSVFGTKEEAEQAAKDLSG